MKTNKIAKIPQIVENDFFTGYLESYVTEQENEIESWEELEQVMNSLFREARKQNKEVRYILRGYR